VRRGQLGEIPMASFLLIPVMRLTAALIAAISIVASAAIAREPGEPIRIVWKEGDVAGQSPILGPHGGAPIGVVEYHQHLDGNELETIRVARFTDGSSDEDTAVARINKTLEGVRGRSIIRDSGGKTIVDIEIDVAAGHVKGFYDDGGKHQDVDMHESLDPATYWGPLIFIVAKNFDANVEDGRVRFKTVAPTPKPRVLTMELADQGAKQWKRMGRSFGVESYVLRPTLGWMLDPIVHRLVPSTEFLVEPGKPPSLARYAGPRNYAGQEIVLE
jgi:hypothetical protein